MLQPQASVNRRVGAELPDSFKSGMTIVLTDDQVKCVNEWIGPINVAHFKEECLPPGFEIVISFAGPDGHWLSARSCGKELELGVAKITPEHDGSWCL